MQNSSPIIVVSEDGVRGEIDPNAQITPGDTSQALIRLESGEQFWVPSNLLTQQPNGTFHLPMQLANLNKIPDQPAGGPTTASQEEPRVVAYPVVEGKVRVHTDIQEHQETVDVPTFTEEVDVQRVPVNQVLDHPVEPRQEGDTLIVPVMEEVLVVEKRLVLKEEVHITRRRQEVREPQSVILRREEVIVEREGPGIEVPPREGARIWPETAVEPIPQTGPINEEQTMPVPREGMLRPESEPRPETDTDRGWIDPQDRG